jgi:hypothetical protein
VSAPAAAPASATIHGLACHEVQELLPAVAEGLLDAEADQQLFLHLADCPACQLALVEHDLLTVALAPSGRRRSTASIGFSAAATAARRRQPLLGLAASLLAAVGLAALAMVAAPGAAPAAQGDSAVALPALRPAAAALPAAYEPIEVLLPSHPRGEPLLRLRQDGQVIVVGLDAVDGPLPAGQRAVVRPVVMRAGEGR